MRKEDSQVAPGTLEVVRTFLNTWRIPNDTREPIDELVSAVIASLSVGNLLSCDINRYHVPIVAWPPSRHDPVTNGRCGHSAP